ERAVGPLVSLTLSKNPNIVFAGGTSLYAYNISTGRVQHTYVDKKRINTEPYYVANDPRTGRIITATGDGDVLAWNQPSTVGVADGVNVRVASLVPNPANDRISITPRIDRQSSVVAHVFDALGRVVVSTPRRVITPDESIGIDVSHLAAGAYHVAVSIDGRTQHLPLVISR
ncbi:MAG: T9SS type A sorting domain-containing protein, partial [bacterium]|nr:T9SS type A sorting domain-containing protein [Candidatus Kapabacteria bacterium]